MECQTRMKLLVCSAILILLAGATQQARAQRIIDLTLDSAVDIAMENSYQVMRLRMGIERTRHNLRSRQAGLKSSVYMNLSAPEIESLSDYKWNSDLQKDEIIHTNTRRWQMDLSIRQPVILFGYPTNGYLSLNNRVYQYIQKKDSGESTDYYNRYFVSFQQPLFVPNELKNDLEQAELDLEREELDFISSIVRMIDNMSDDYYELFELASEHELYLRHVDTLERITKICEEFCEVDTTRTLELMQAQVELANTRERLSQNQIDRRIEIANTKQELILDPADSVFVSPKMKEIVPIKVDREQAIAYGYELQPRMRTLEISRRRNEIMLEDTKARGAFNVNLEMTYGLEKQDEEYDRLWAEQDNSYSVSVEAYIPIWDWGERKERILAREISLRQTDLNMEEARTQISTNITNAIDNMEVYQQRALSMQENVEVSRNLTERSIEEYYQGRISITDLLGIVNRHRDTEINFVQAYLGWRRSILRLTMNTYYDYEKNMSLLDSILARDPGGIAMARSNEGKTAN
ncbi:TolC family protein [Candidatus Latescibacterota bacterium]